MLECKCEGFAPKLLENGEPLNVDEQGMCSDHRHLRKIMVPGHGETRKGSAVVLRVEGGSTPAEGEKSEDHCNRVGRTSQLSKMLEATEREVSDRVLCWSPSP